MTTGPGDSEECRRLLEGMLGPASPTASDLAALGRTGEAALDEALRGFVTEHAAAALPLLTALTGETVASGLRRAARRALYRLSRRGVTPPAPAPASPVVARRPERAARAWLSGIDGTGTRATWIVFETAYGGTELCSLLLADSVGVADVAGGEISKRRLATELAELRASQKLPWVETDPERVLGLVAEALALHRRLGTSPPAAFARWQSKFADVAVPPPPPLAAEPDPALVARAAELFELPEIAGWYIDPASIQSDALDLLQARESRLVVPDQVKAEREEAVITRALERELDADARTRWARRLAEMALIFDATDRPEPARLAREAGGALVDPARAITGQPFARALVTRGLEVAGEIASGRVGSAEASRTPADPRRASPA
jgi:hypothetical protein